MNSIIAQISSVSLAFAVLFLSACSSGNYRAPVEDASQESSSSDRKQASSEGQEEESGVKVFSYAEPTATTANTSAPAQTVDSPATNANAAYAPAPPTGESPSSKYSAFTPSDSSSASEGALANQYASPQATDGGSAAPSYSSESASQNFQSTPGVMPTSQSTPVASLLAMSDSQVSTGDYPQAAASLERALRIEPKNASLWHALAKVRLEQGKWDETESLALKSNSLAGGDQPNLVTENWRMIAEARRRNGDPQGAAAAENQANQF